MKIFIFRISDCTYRHQFSFFSIFIPVNSFWPWKTIHTRRRVYRQDDEKMSCWPHFHYHDRMLHRLTTLQTLKFYALSLPLLSFVEIINWQTEKGCLHNERPDNGRWSVRYIVQGLASKFEQTPRKHNTADPKRDTMSTRSGFESVVAGLPGRVR